MVNVHVLTEDRAIPRSVCVHVTGSLLSEATVTHWHWNTRIDAFRIYSSILFFSPNYSFAGFTVTTLLLLSVRVGSRKEGVHDGPRQD